MEGNKNEQDENEQNKKLVIFGDSKIRREWHNNEWHFSVVDIIAALTGTVDANDYWYRLKKREADAGVIELSTICRRLKLIAEDGKMRLTDCANRRNALRLVQSILSKKSEPFKQWLADVGEDRLQETEDPELAQKRMKETYRKKGYSDEWIEKRVRGIAIRQELTDEWKKRNVQTKKDFAMLTNEITHATFGKTVDDYKQHKRLRRNDNLRDHMDDTELILTMLGEITTTRLTRERESERFPELQNDAKDGGDVSGGARKAIEKKLGKTIVSEDNYLDIPEKEKRKLLEKKKRTPTVALT